LITFCFFVLTALLFNSRWELLGLMKRRPARCTRPGSGAYAQEASCLQPLQRQQQQQQQHCLRPRLLQMRARLGKRAAREDNPVQPSPVAA